MNSLFDTQIISLNPVPTKYVQEQVVLMPLVNQILMNPNNIYFDPFQVYNSIIPGNIGYYISYPDLNTDIDIQKNILNKIWTKLTTKWVFNFVKIFKYISWTNNNYKLISNLDDIEKNKINSEEIENKAEWFFKNFYKRSNLASTIEKYRARTSIDWWDIDKNIDHLKQFIYHQIRRKLLEKISS